ncbi:MAG: hypothetical protein ABW185_17945, partial [Sedimenticola sp.]
KILIFDEATSALDPETAEHFATTVNQLRGNISMIFITHALPKSLQVDEVVRIGGERATVLTDKSTSSNAHEMQGDEK